MHKNDKLFVWHPYASAIDKNPIYGVKKAKGVYIYLDSGEKLIDGMSSWWCVINGYNHPVLNNAIKTSIKTQLFFLIKSKKGSITLLVKILL